MKVRTDKYYSSKEAKAALKVQDCELAHIRNSGKLKFTKKGNAFMYSVDSINQLLSIKDGLKKQYIKQ